MSNDLFASYSLNPNSISAVTGVNVSEGCQRNLVNNAQRQAISMVKANFAANAGTITTSSILALASISTGDYILLTPSGGSTSISSFGDAPEGLSKQARALGTIILRHDTSKINLPGGSDLTISTGDIINVRALSGAAWNVTHVPYNGIPQSIVNASSVTASETSSLLILSGGAVQKANAGAINFSGPRTYRALSTGYTVSAGDNNAILDFTTAGVTCAFVPLASLSDGFTVTIMNNAASGDVTLNPDASETLDGLTTRLLRPTDRVDLLKTTSSFKTTHGTYSFRSANLSISVSTSVAVPHGLGVEVTYDSIGLGIVNETADLGYSISEYVSLANVLVETGSGARALGVYADATNINVLWGTSSIGIINKGTLITGTINTASWKLRVTAKVRYG